MNFGNIKKIADNLAAASESERIHVKMLDNGNLEILPYEENDNTIQYDWDLVPALKKFMLGDEDIPVKIVIGGYGSGKTSAMVQAILRDAVLMRPCDDGIRRYKIAIVRNTAGDLDTTTLKTWMFWTKNLPIPKQNKKPVFTLRYDLKDKDGDILLEVLFLALDRPHDFNKLASLELTAAFFNEIQFIPKSLLDHMQSRINRYPAKVDFTKQFTKQFNNLSHDEQIKMWKKWRPFRSRIFADTNAPEEDHWIAALIEKEKPKDIKVYHQPPALLKTDNGEWVINENADNLQNVGIDYYLDMIGRGEEYVRVYAQGKYGTAFDGQPVYQAYNDDLHSVETIGIIPDEIVYLGFDYGTVSPACVLAQFIDGQLRIIKEFIGEYMSVKDLYVNSIAPFLIKHCKDMPLEAIGDPADTYDGRAQLLECDLEVLPARTNQIGARISCVTNLLNRLSYGKPRIIISRRNCKKLRSGFIGKYHYRRLRIVGEERYQNIPNKNHPFSDVHDAVQYIVLTLLDEEGINNAINEPIYRSNWDEQDRSEVTGY